jgi:hypothetical protein
MDDPTPPLRYWVRESQVYANDGEQIGWVTTNGYIFARRPREWLTPHPPVIGYQDPAGVVRFWGQRVRGGAEPA